MDWKLSLGISAVVVLFIGVSIFVGIYIWTKKYTKKFIEKTQRENIEQLKSIRNDMGILPFELENNFKNKINPYDIEGVINTIFLNNYKTKLIIAKDEEFSFACVSLKTKDQIYYELKEFNFEKYNQVRFEKPEYFPNEILPYNGQNLDFVGVFRSNYGLEEIFEKYYSILNPNGMIMVLLKNYSKRSLKAIIQTLKSKNINYEVSYISSKFLFISKKIEI
ncbi:BC85_0335 family putative methyltransferase [Mycoplasmopsis cynos]|uniref:BC85_0335 family putative methyltransferase n=1 Tax=Mycoplasmopsis cynos TaxID=171284 RepID=UPI002AFEE5E5|nr:hypothetical protein [Mycoplasmopsis cynos]WQQ16307.1 hypothetical protein RRG51_00895 [Mycoplasmopsis cynos]WQQ17796.1 hypothetical protein RRG56_00585 [Mycoplasmopsis cynos]